MKRGYEAIVGGLIWAALVLQFWLLIDKAIANGLTVWIGVARYFGYFTILTNILVALVLTVPLLIPDHGLGRFLSQPSVRTATAGYIIVVGVIYSLVLRDLWNPEGLQLIADRMLHDFSPIAYVFDWLLFVPKSFLRVEDLPSWLIYPGTYAIAALVRGAIFGWYPYPFLNAGELGYPQVLLNVALLLVGFLVLGLMLIKLGQRLKYAKIRRI
ncbi:Pr6Pr family membrane protein [Leptolyngbya ohadii]|uniref:Pr6Pr family membrane protein n=1 Tax=Leptolyngbya ohadii TaxID=1962290 RepID=UPI000B59CF90|nr:Pr6Pr family membrane protein [Leptolyngbya ohadii]